MKNLNYISALLFAAALITGCSNEEIMENGTPSDDVTLIATTGVDTRTTVDGNKNLICSMPFILLAHTIPRK